MHHLLEIDSIIKNFGTRQLLTDVYLNRIEKHYFVNQRAGDLLLAWQERYGKIRVDANNLRNNESRPEIYPVG